MKKKKRTNEDWLKALTIQGRIMVAVPLIAGLVTFIISMLLPSDLEVEPAIEGPTIAVLHYNPVAGTLTSGAFLIFICGLTILVYVAIKRFRQGLHGEEGAK